MMEIKTDIFLGDSKDELKKLTDNSKYRDFFIHQARLIHTHDK
jgi:hypothetical protein